MPNHCMTSVDVMIELLDSNPDVTEITLAIYPQKAAPSPVSRLATLCDILLRHKENDEEPVPRGSVSKDELWRRCNELPLGKCLGVRAKVTSMHGAQFIPMLDFACEKNKRNTRFLAGLLTNLIRIRDLGMGGGYLLATTNSYHYYDRAFLPIDRWITFVGYSLLMHPPAHYLPLTIRLKASSIIDARFLGHSLIARQGTLRISGDLAGHLPTVVAEIG